MFRKKLRGYRAAFRVETNRAAAEQLRREDPQIYQRILTMAEGEAAQAAAKDPDAFVALVLAAAEDEGVVGASAAPWPDAPSEAAPFCNGTERKPHSPVKTTPVEDPFEPTYRCPTCGREQRVAVEQMVGQAVEQKLGRELFDHDRDAYIRLAGELVSDSEPQLPDALREIVTRMLILLMTYFDPEMRTGDGMTPLAGALSRFYTQVLSGAYFLAQQEEWEAFDVAEFNRLADDCLAVHGRSQAREQEASRIAAGVSGQLDDYAPLTAYVGELPAYIRLGEFADTYAIIPSSELRALMDRDDSLSEKAGWTSTLAWTSGVMLALLTKAGRTTGLSEAGESFTEATEDSETELGAESSFEAMPLNGELFDEDPEHEAYWTVVAEILEGVDHEEVPEITRQMSLNQIQHLLSLQRSSGFDYWIQDLAGTFCDAYFLADAEEWEVEAEIAAELIEECMFTVNKSRLAVGTGEVTKADYSTWISIVLNGMHSELGEWEPLNDYLRAEGAWERLDEWLYPTYLTRHKTEPRAGDVEQWRFANRTAWRNSIFLNLLYRLGYLSAEPGQRGFDSGDRPLSGTLFELDPQQYQMTAAQLMQATAHDVPDVAKELYWHLIGPLVDQKLARNYGRWLRDTFECGYVLCSSEAWDGLDEDTLGELIDEGLRTVIREKDSRDPDILLADPEYRIRNVSYGIVFGMPYFTRLTQYLEEQDAFQRIAGLGEMMLTGVAASGAIKRRHAAKLESPLRLSFLLGVSVGVLDQLGEVPPEMPARLP